MEEAVAWVSQVLLEGCHSCNLGPVAAPPTAMEGGCGDGRRGAAEDDWAATQVRQARHGLRRHARRHVAWRNEDGSCTQLDCRHLVVQKGGRRYVELR